jgi:hypothetical protein
VWSLVLNSLGIGSEHGGYVFVCIIDFTLSKVLSYVFGPNMK